MTPKIDIVIPCYNEDCVINKTTDIVLGILNKLKNENKISEKSTIIYVDDGSKDQTWKSIERLIKNNQHIEGIKLSRNYGHQKALLAGLMNSDADATISLDADLQDDPNAISQMVEAYLEDYDIVYAVRNSRRSDTIFKRWTAIAFYKLLNALGADIVFNHADYRLMSRRAINNFKLFEESNLFIRGIIPMLGFKSKIVYYDRAERFSGSSKYPLKKMLSFAWEGITSLSVKPIKIITILGITISIFSLSLAIWALSISVFTNKTVPGWASTVLPLYFLGGIQLLCTGIIGEYIGKIYSETKRRPRFIIEKIIE